MRKNLFLQQKINYIKFTFLPTTYFLYVKTLICKRQKNNVILNLIKMKYWNANIGNSGKSGVSVAAPGFLTGGVNAKKGVGAPTYYLVKCLPKTVWNWKKLDREGVLIPSAPLDSPLTLLSVWIWKDEWKFTNFYCFTKCKRVCVYFLLGLFSYPIYNYK